MRHTYSTESLFTFFITTSDFSDTLNIYASDAPAAYELYSSRTDTTISLDSIKDVINYYHGIAPKENYYFTIGEADQAPFTANIVSVSWKEHINKVVKDEDGKYHPQRIFGLLDEALYFVDRSVKTAEKYLTLAHLAQRKLSEREHPFEDELVPADSVFTVIIYLSRYETVALDYYSGSTEYLLHYYDVQNNDARELHTVREAVNSIYEKHRPGSDYYAVCAQTNTEHGAYIVPVENMLEWNQNTACPDARYQPLFISESLEECAVYLNNAIAVARAGLPTKAERETM